MDRRAIAERERERKRRGMYPQRHVKTANMRDERLAALESRVKTLENALQAALFPEPDEDTGWSLLEPGNRIEWWPDDRRPLSRIDVLKKTGPDTFEPVPDNRADGDGVWWKSRDRRNAGTGSQIEGRVLYNISRDPVEVRVQAFYGS